MEEFIFFAVIILFSIIESAARKRKAMRGGAQESSPTLPEQWSGPSREWEEDLPSYDADGSYDHEKEDDDGIPGEPLPGYTTPYESGGGRPPSDETPPQTMLPGDLLEELAGLLGGDQPSGAETIRLPRQSPPLPSPEALEPARSREIPVTTRSRSPRPLPEQEAMDPPRSREFPVATRSRAPRHGQHQVHGAHEGYGTDPSTRAPSEQDGLDPLAEVLSQDAATIRQQLMSHGAHALRQAVILQEVLGPPVALGGNRFDD